MLSSRSFASMKYVLLPYFHANKGNLYCPCNNGNDTALNRKKMLLERSDIVFNLLRTHRFGARLDSIYVTLTTEITFQREAKVILRSI